MRNIKERNLQNIGEDIGAELGAKFVKNFRDAYPKESSGYFIGREILDKILAQPGCIGISYYNAINEFGHKTLVCMGIDCDKNIISEYSVVTEKGDVKKMKGIVADRIGSEGWLEDLLRKLGW